MNNEITMNRVKANRTENQNLTITNIVVNINEFVNDKWK